MPGEWKTTQGEIARLENPGDNLEGTLVNVRDGNYFRPDGGKSKVYDFKLADGKIKTVFGSMVLERQMGSIKIGTEVKVIFKGLVSTKTGRKAKNFEVYTR